MMKENGAGGFGGILYKWTNYAKGWKLRWFLLNTNNAVISYSSKIIQVPPAAVAVAADGDDDDIRLHNNTRSSHNHHHRHETTTHGRVLHLKVTSFRESRTDERKFYIFTPTKTLHLRTSSNKHKLNWIQALFTSTSSRGLNFNDNRQQLDDGSDDDQTYFFDTQDFFPELITQPQVMAETGQSEIERRKKLPEPAEKEKGVGLWSLIKDNIGKDLTRVCLPVYFNEPISSLQKCFEELEYSYLLDRAYQHGKQGNSLERILNVAAFAVSGYAASDGRHCKPFNPLLGETYEADYPEKGVRFFSEKVSHHPTLIACHSEGKGWKFWGDSNIRTKFWGRAIQLDPIGVLTLEFDDGEVFQWSKVTTSIYNLILGKVYCDHHGTMHICGNREYSCKLRFNQQSIFERNPRQVHGFVEDCSGKKHATLFGKWDDNMYYINSVTNVKPKDMSDANLLWQRIMPPTNLTRYNLTSFAITLNELTPGLQEKLPPTDSRLRPDQRYLENGEYDMANSEKLRLETRQRMSRKLQENGWKPRWFQKEREEGTYRYVGGYWDKREEHNWDDCPNIFGDFSDEISDSTSKH